MPHRLHDVVQLPVEGGGITEPGPAHLGRRCRVARPGQQLARRPHASGGVRGPGLPAAKGVCGVGPVPSVVPRGEPRGGPEAEPETFATPKLPPPPPRHAQKRSGSCCASALTMRPSAVTTSIPVNWSQVRPTRGTGHPLPLPASGPRCRRSDRPGGQRQPPAGDRRVHVNQPCAGPDRRRRPETRAAASRLTSRTRPEPMDQPP